MENASGYWMEAAGIEPASVFNRSRDSAWSCVKSVPDTAGNVLVDSGTDWLRMSELDTDLQSVLLAWGRISPQVRESILLLTQPIACARD